MSIFRTAAKAAMRASARLRHKRDQGMQRKAAMTENSGVYTPVNEHFSIIANAAMRPSARL